jgi:hypothetical protein
MGDPSVLVLWNSEQPGPGLFSVGSEERHERGW